MQLAKTSHRAGLKNCLVPLRVANAVRDHGVLPAMRRGWRRAGDAWREWRLGIRTVGSIDAASLDTGPDSFGYQPIPYAAFASALRSVHVGAHDVFVDLGCGMGRAVILAGLDSFRRVIGVEISAELCTLARRNVRNARRYLRAQEVDIVEADAGKYVLPDDATVLLLFNPFDEPIVRRVLENARQSLERSPRELTVIYAIPACRPDLLADVPWLRLVRTLRIPDEEWLRLGIYCSKEGAPCE